MSKTKKEKKIESPFTPEQEAIMQLANKYNALHKDVKLFEAALQVIPLTQNIILAIARICGVSPEKLARAIASTKENKVFEETLTRAIKKQTGTTMKAFNKKVVKK